MCHEGWYGRSFIGELGVDVVSARNILDVGTGTGLISLMMAQRCNAQIRAVDIDADAVEQARGNVAASPWQDRIEVELQDIWSFYIGNTL